MREGLGSRLRETRVWSEGGIRDREGEKWRGGGGSSKDNQLYIDTICLRGNH